jgi:hypothetical protein
MTEPIKILVALLLAEMDLKPEQVTLYNQKFEIPTDERLYINLAVLGAKDFAVRNKWENDPISKELVEVQGINRQQLISVMVYSRGSAARERNWEIPLVFSSVRAEQAMAANSFSIGRLPTSMNDISDLDGTSRLNRYSLTFALQSRYEKVKPVPFYDQFDSNSPVIITNP